MILHDYLPSGNGYKVRLLLKQLGREYRLVQHDIVAGETHTAEFLKLNANGKIPLLELDGGRTLSESNAIIWYLAEDTAFLPDEKWARAQVMQWLCWEQYSHEPNIASPRFWLTHAGMNAQREAQLPAKREAGYAALQLMDDHLVGRTFFVDDRYTIADIALYAYTHVAPEGQFDLTPYTRVRRWLAAVAEQPRHTLITET